MWKISKFYLPLTNKYILNKQDQYISIRLVFCVIYFYDANNKKDIEYVCMGISGTGVLWPQMAWFVWLKSDFLRNNWIYLYINQSLIGDLKDLVKKLFALSKMDIMTGTELISQLCLAKRKAPLLMLITLYNLPNGHFTG